MDTGSPKGHAPTPKPNPAAPPRGNEGDVPCRGICSALRVTVKDGERAFLTRNGRLERVLAPGRHRLFDPLRELAAEVHQVVRAEFTPSATPC